MPIKNEGEMTLERLEEIIDKLEMGNLTVEDGVKLFEEGAKILKVKEQEIKTNKSKVVVLKDILKESK